MIVNDDPVVRYDKLGYVALNVTDVRASRPFYEERLGLKVVAGGEREDVLFLRCSDRHHDVILYEGAVPGLKRVGWQMEDEAQLGLLRKRFAAHGVAVTDVDAEERQFLHQGETFRIVEPHTGATHEFYATIGEFGNDRYVPTVAKIQRLGHVVVKTTDLAETLDFYRNVMGFRISDLVGNQVAFLRCFPNRFHHSFAICAAPMAGLHHVNLMVSEIDDIGKGIWRFNKNQIPVVHGPGRHPPSGSVFLYFLEPDGLTLEYSYGMEEFDEKGARRAQQLEMVPGALDYWGADVDHRKASIGTIELPESSARAAVR